MITTTVIKRRHPAFLQVERKRAQDAELRIADGITRFAGSMRFVYIHAAVFAVWCATGLFGLDHYPFSFLTLIVSLEAIFLSTFVMIGQNRQGEFAQAKADHDFHEEEVELRTNTELTREIHRLIAELNARVLGEDGSDEHARTEAAQTEEQEHRAETD